MPPPAILAVEHLCKSYGELRAVDDVSFQVAPGEIVGLVGPNGAGKTTTLNMILGVLAPTAGRIEIEGVDLARARSRALSRTNFAAVYAPLPGNLTVEQNLRVFGMIYAVEHLTQRIERLLVDYDLVRFRRTRAGCYRRASKRGSVWPRRCSIVRGCSCSTNPPPRSTPRARATSARASPPSSTRATAGCCGPATTCTRSRRSATACFSCRGAKSCSRAIPRRCRTSTARPAWTTCSWPWRTRRCTSGRARAMNASRVAAIVVRQLYLYRSSPQRVAADVRLGGARHRAVGLHHPLPERGRHGQASTSCRRCWARCCCGTS